MLAAGFCAPPESKKRVLFKESTRVIKLRSGFVDVCEMRLSKAVSSRLRLDRSTVFASLKRLVASLLLAAALFHPGWCQSSSSPQQAPEDLTALSLEQLMNTEVTSVFKKKQKLSQAPAAIHVI